MLNKLFFLALLLFVPNILFAAGTTKSKGYRVVEFLNVWNKLSFVDDDGNSVTLKNFEVSRDDYVRLTGREPDVEKMKKSGFVRVIFDDPVRCSDSCFDCKNQRNLGHGPSSFNYSTDSAFYSLEDWVSAKITIYQNRNVLARIVAIKQDIYGNEQNLVRASKQLEELSVVTRSYPPGAKGVFDFCTIVSLRSGINHGIEVAVRDEALRLAKKHASVDAGVQADQPKSKSKPEPRSKICSIQ